MDHLNRERLKELLGEHRAPCISMYIPTYRKGAETEQNQIRFKNKVREAEKLLQEKGYRAGQIDPLLQQAKNLYNDDNFWNFQQDGLAVFIAQNKFYCYRLPKPFEEMLMINDHFYVKPLIPVLSGKEFFYILSLDKKQMRLFRAGKYGIKNIELKDFPLSVEEFTSEFAEEKYLFRKSEFGGQPRQGMYVGPGHGTDDIREQRDLLRFFQTFDKKLFDLIKPGNPPLLLAGVEYLIPIYREASSYGNLVEQAVTVNTDFMQPEELHSHALKVMEPHLKKTQENHLFQFEQLYDTEKTSDDLMEIITAAYSKRVAVLFFNPDVKIWGRFNSVDFSVDIHDSPMPGDEDLLNFAAVQTLLYDGTIYALPKEDMPMGQSAAAILRF